MILHIPHSSTHIPELESNSKITQNDINLLTDWYTDELFDHEFATRVVFEWSRLVCDVERYRNDGDEPMTKFGHGVVYLNGATGNKIRDYDKNLSDVTKVLLYDAHHSKLNKITGTSLALFNEVVLVDCHSFSDAPLVHEDDTAERPDFCIGTNGDLPFTDDLIKVIESNGYSVKLNYPFSGAMVPSLYTNEKSLKCVMIEVNRKLYLDDKYNKNNNFDTIKNLITKLLDVVNDYEDSNL